MNFETHSGRYFDYDNPQPEQVTLGDIAQSLVNVPRFGGHTSRHYSVLEHAILVTKLVARTSPYDKVKLAALHHDSHEAYLGDIPTPLKLTLGEAYYDLVDKADVAIGGSFGIPVAGFLLDSVKEADALALRIEAAYLKESKGVGEHWHQDGLPPEVLSFPIAHVEPDRNETMKTFGDMHRRYGGA